MPPPVQPVRRTDADIVAEWEAKGFKLSAPVFGYFTITSAPYAPGDGPYQVGDQVPDANTATWQANYQAGRQTKYANLIY